MTFLNCLDSGLQLTPRGEFSATVPVGRLWLGGGIGGKVSRILFGGRRDIANPLWVYDIPLSKPGKFYLILVRRAYSLLPCSNI